MLHIDAAQFNPADIIIAATSMIAVIVTLISALTTTRQSAFNQLKQVVSTLQTQLETTLKKLEESDDKILKLETSVLDEKTKRQKFENWARRLVRQLKSHNIKPVSFK